MKKLLITLTLITLFISITSCTLPSHVHFYGEEYEYDEENHWKKCQSENCEKINLKDTHTYTTVDTSLNGTTITSKKICMCGYEKIQETEYDAVVDTSEEWDIIFQTLKLTNYSLIVSEKTNEGTESAKCLVTEDNAMMQYAYEDYPDYAIKNIDGTYNNYSYSSYSDKYYVEENTTDEFYQEIVGESTLKFDLVNYFDKFTYDNTTGTYKSKEVITATVYPDDEYDRYNLYLYNIEILFADGKLFSLKANFYDEYDSTIDSKYSLEYFDIGTTIVTLPKEVLEKIENGSFME